ncbi:NAD(P)H-dependent glycerol-3-phosphate dehydrogenase [Parasphingorhabdus sp. DH2-15]|uniref:NAD(P)H-dependent glycerol-3-phosphate dehydrogenase n=1 Tax=Parasphingorhabdus sp. DH2-15 TaxID=3444112 RepID=UPI003F6822CC
MSTESPKSEQTPIIGVLGAGAWGTALAQLIASNGTKVRLWAREAEVADAINSIHQNSAFLPDIPLSCDIHASTELSALNGCNIILAVTPAQHLASTLAGLDSIAQRDLILCCKGIEASTGRFMHEVAKSAQPDAQIAVLSGPTFAHELALGKPAAVTLACENRAQWDRLSNILVRPHFRPYYSADLMGAEIGGAVKNVLAIACGVADGLGLGQNARAALISRGYAEMVRFGEACGAEPETLTGLCGLGDLVLTCSSTSSRNFSLGIALGQGKAAAQLLADRATVAEGAHSAAVVQRLAREKAVQMPLVDAVCALLSGDFSADNIITSLLSRPLQAE